MPETVLTVSTGASLLLSIVSCTALVRFCLKRRKVLLFQILLGAVFCFMLGEIYNMAHLWVVGTLKDGFSIPVLTRTGFWFFLFTSSYGALDSLVDDKSPSLRPKRLIAAAVALVVAALSVVSAFIGEFDISALLKGIPMTFVCYYTVKQLILPDIDLGYVRALRPYNITVLATSVVELTGELCSALGLNIAGSAVSLLLALLLPVIAIASKKGVDKWYT